MAEVKTIKDIDEETWAEFKSLAARNKVKLGTFFKSMVKEHEKAASSFWEKVLHEDRILSEEEALEIDAVTKRVRKDYGFRK